MHAGTASSNPTVSHRSAATLLQMHPPPCTQMPVHKHIHAPPHQPPTTPGVRRYAFNLFSHNSPMTENGYNEEEMKMVKETRKIWNCPGVQVGRTVGYMWV